MIIEDCLRIIYGIFLASSSGFMIFAVQLLLFTFLLLLGRGTTGTANQVHFVNPIKIRNKGTHRGMQG